VTNTFWTAQFTSLAAAAVTTPGIVTYLLPRRGGFQARRAAWPSRR
jgi:hypothetical protein